MTESIHHGKIKGFQFWIVSNVGADGLGHCTVLQTKLLQVKAHT